MKHLRVVIGAAATLVLLSAPLGHAATIGFSPTPAVVPVGQIAAIDLYISGLGEGTLPALSAFDLNVAYDPALLQYTGTDFGDAVLGDQLDLSGLGSISGADAAGGLVNLFEISLDDPNILNTLQAGTFILATLHFSGLSAGMSPLSLTVNTLGDAYGNPLSADLVDGSVNSVPEPASVALVCAGLVVLAGRAYQKRRR